MNLPTIPRSEFASRRRKLRRLLGKAVGLLFAGESDASLADQYRPHRHFHYFTGIEDEPGAVLLLDPAHPVESRREMLFLRPLNPELEKWDGYRLEIGSDLKERTGFTSIFRTTHLPRMISEAVRRSRTLACLHPFANYTQPVSPDLDLFRKIAERVPGVEIIDRTEAPVLMRSVKSRPEIAVMKRAADITAKGFAAAMALVRPGVNESDVQAAIEQTYRAEGSTGPAFGTIVGSGINSTVLHYRSNIRVIEDGDLICIDSGAAFGGYGADVTRTIPARGRFTDHQREIYEVVLRALNAATKAVRPGVTLAEVDRVARAVIDKAGYGDFFIHSIGHHLGLETHDVTPDGPLKEGNVITVEPGIYLPDEALGVRIEDDVQVTKGGHRNLTQAIPRTIREIESAMSGGR